MADAIEFYFEFASPYSYLAAQRLPALAARVGRSLRWRPIQMGKVWAGQGILEAYRAIQGVKRRYIIVDARRTAAELGVPFRLPEPFPPDATLARLAVHGLEAREPGLGGRLALGLWRRLWTDGGSIATLEDLRAAAPDGLAADALLAAADDPAARAALDAANADAVAAGCFGIPWIMADGEAYFGQDRLDMLERRLAP